MQQYWLFWAALALSVVCVIHLWKYSEGSVPRKLVWSAVMLFPIMGPLMYGAIYDAPSEQDEDSRAAETDMDSEDPS